MKANWKKILMGGILLSASAVLLTACGGAEKTKAENESGSANKAAGDVKLWVDTEYMGVFKKVVADFEKENPDIKVNLTAGNSADAKKDIAKDPKAAANVAFCRTQTNMHGFFCIKISKFTFWTMVDCSSVHLILSFNCRFSCIF